MKEPKVYIVTLNWNGLDDTLGCLKSLEKLKYKNYRTIIVDNASATGEADTIKARFPQIELIKNKKNLGFTGGCNQGIDQALKSGADYVLLLNNDTTVQPSFLTRIVEFYETTPDAGMVSPVLLYPDRKTIWSAGSQVVLGLARHQHKGQTLAEANLSPEPFKTTYVPGTAMLVSTELIKKIGKLDDKYFAYYEDLDWCLRAERAGYYSYVAPSALVYHKKSASTGEGGRAKFNKIPAYYMARNSLLLSSNYESFNKLVFILAQLFIKLPLSLLLLVKPSAWASYLKGTWAGLRD